MNAKRESLLELEPQMKIFDYPLSVDDDGTLV